MKGCNLSFYTLKPIKASFICNHYHHLIYYSYFIIKNDSQIRLVMDQPDTISPRTSNNFSNFSENEHCFSTKAMVLPVSWEFWAICSSDTKTYTWNNMHISKSNQIIWLFWTNTISRTDAIKKTLKINYKRSMHSYYSLMLQHIGKESMMNSVIKASSIVLRVICTSIKF